MSINFVENNNKMTDDEVIKLINAGNYELFSIMINRYLPLTVKIAKNYLPENEIEDAVQEATLVLYSAIKNYDSAKASFATFAEVCIKRSVIAQIRKSNSQKNIPESLLTSIEEIEVSDHKNPENILIEKENYKTLADNIKLELSGLEYKVLQLFLIGESYSEIAEKLDIGEKSVDNALARIRKKLKK